MRHQGMTVQPTTPTPPTAEEAIEWALSNLESFEMQDYLRDWRDRKDLSPWHRARELDVAFAMDITTG